MMPANHLSGLFKATLTGKVFLICKEEGVLDATRMRSYEQAIVTRLEKAAAEHASMGELQQKMNDELVKLRKILRGEIDADESVLLEVEAFDSTDQSLLDDLDLDNILGSVDEADSGADDLSEEDRAEEEEQARPSRKPRKESGYKPTSMDMHEKLEIQRKPVAELLRVDCVGASLLSQKRADHWIHNMAGRIKEEVETDIVAELAQNLHDRVKGYIRANKGDNPWSTPQLQNDLRTDIMSVKTVRGILLLHAQISQEVDRHEAGKKPGIMKRLWKKSKL